MLSVMVAVLLDLEASVLSGVSLDGERYFCVNPHASSGGPTDWGGPWNPSARRGVPTRQE